jgi:hypothetical protein
VFRAEPYMKKKLQLAASTGEIVLFEPPQPI